MAALHTEIGCFTVTTGAGPAPGRIAINASLSNNVTVEIAVREERDRIVRYLLDVGQLRVWCHEHPEKVQVR